MNYLPGTKLHMLDSGAFALINKAMKSSKDSSIDYSAYSTKEFWEYVDSYAKFIKRHQSAIDYYVNIDAIYNPELSWKIQLYIEDTHGLKPIPVIHVGTSAEWIDKYRKRGHTYIGFGGIAKGVLKKSVTPWLNEMFSHICAGPKRIPDIKVHGFGVGNTAHIIRYPWYSIDSTTWIKMSAYGQILVPVERKGKFVWNRPAYRLFIDSQSPYTTKDGAHFTKEKHFISLNSAAKSSIMRWLALIGVPLGDSRGKKIVTEGVTNSDYFRKVTNIKYFEWLQQEIPPWPRRFKKTSRSTKLLDNNYLNPK